MLKKKRILLFGILMVILVGAGLLYRTLSARSADQAQDLQTALVERGSLTTTLSSVGNVRTGQTATITWEASGKVGEVALKTGDAVEEGQVLAALDPGTLSAEMIQARQDLINAQQNLDDLLNSTLLQAQALQAVVDAQQALDSLKQTAAEEAGQAQLALAEAQSALDDAERTRTKMNYPHSSDQLVIEKAETDYLLAKQTYKEALKAYNKVAKRKLTDPERTQALSRLVTAEQDMNTKLATYNWYLMDYTEEDIAQADAELAVAQANLESAQADWDRLKGGINEAEIALAEATLADAVREYERVKNGPSADDVAAAQAAVDIAQTVLDHAQLLAPFAGTITEVDVKSGDLVRSGDSAFRVDDLASVYVDLQISEVDLADLQVGQLTTLEFDAIPDRQYRGEVSEIGMVGTVSQGVVNYPLTIRVADVDQNIRPGMTASVSIILDQREDVLLVPNRAIRSSSGQQSVTVLFEGQQISVPVTLGLIGDSMSEVVSSQLREGDAVVINGTVSAASGTTNMTRGNMNMPGGFVVSPGGMLP